MTRPLRVLIAGAGIGGLAAAIALRRSGLAVQIVERRAVLAEEGAGLQLGPNAVAVLTRLGVVDRLKPTVHTPRSIIMRDGESGRLIKVLPLGAWISGRHGAPYWTAHRVDLHEALRATAEAAGLVIETGSDIRTIDATPDGVAATTADGHRYAGEVLIGADGLWSRVRSTLFDLTSPTPTGWYAARATLPRAAVPADLPVDDVGVWMMPLAHVVHYPVRNGAEINIVVVLRGLLGDADHWSSPVDRAELVGAARAFARPLRQLLEQVPAWLRWPLLGRAPLASYARGRVALIGDAAHPTFPFFAQGAAMAIEDAEALVSCLAGNRATPAAALVAYDHLRRDYTQKLVRAAESNGRIYHLGGPLRMARNAALAMIPGAILMSQYDWIYRDKRPVLNS